MASSITVLVTGATGKQGGSVARLLLKQGHKVRAFTRNAQSPAAQELDRLGAELKVGDLEDRAEVGRAMQGADAVFAVATPFEAGMDAEVRQGVNLADAAEQAGVGHLVYSSVGSANRRTGIPHFDTKKKVEEHIEAIGVPYTIVAPVYFMENVFSLWTLPALRQGKLAIPLPPGRSLAQVALADVAGFAVLAMEQRDRFLGRRVDIASDDLPGLEAAAILSRVTGREIEYVQVPMAQVHQMSEDFAIMFEWFDAVGYSLDIQGLRRDYPEVGWHRYEDWAREQDWSVLTDQPAG
jgi:uncharacterized protein YbjT (DUF2867 family)